MYVPKYAALMGFLLVACTPGSQQAEPFDAGNVDMRSSPADAAQSDAGYDANQSPDTNQGPDAAILPDATVRPDRVVLYDGARPDTATSNDTAWPDTARPDNRVLWDSNTPNPDANGAPDSWRPDTASGYDAGQQVGEELNPGWIGGACQSSGNCTNPVPICETSDFPNGMCSEACAQATSGAYICPDTDYGAHTLNTITRCIESGDGQPRCVSECDFTKSISGCRPGYSCYLKQRYQQPSSVFPVCLPSHSQGWPGEYSPFDIGDSCQDDDECEGLLCLNMPGGYCSRSMCDYSGCPDGSSCFVDTASNYTCLKDCASSAACRQGEGYYCEPSLDACVASEPQVNGTLSTVDGMDVLWLWGTRDEMGYAEGALLCGRITRIIQEFVLNFVVANSGYTYQQLTSALAEPTYLIDEGDRREMAGIITGMQENCTAGQMEINSAHLEPAAGGSRAIRYQDLVVAHIIADYACSSLTVWGDESSTGETLHARNLDFIKDPQGVIVDEHLVKIYRSSEDNNAKWASVTFPGQIGCISCFTEEGVGLTMHNVREQTTTSSSGKKARMLAMRSALVATVGASNKVTAAEGVLEASPQDAMGSNFHMSLPCGNASCIGAVVLEYDGNNNHSHGRVTVREPGDVSSLQYYDALVATNHYLERSSPPSSGNSLNRYNILANGIISDSSGLTVAEARALLSSAAAAITNPPTIHSVIMDTSNMNLRVYVPSNSGDAPDFSPSVLDLDALFSQFP